MQDGLKRAATRGIAWTFLNSTLVRILQIVATLVLAKLLSPADFGVFALATMITNAMTIFSDTGFAQALIYRQGDVRHGANTAFVLCAAVNGALAIVASIAAPLLGRAFESPQIVAPLRVMAVGLVLWGVASVPMALLDKELMFKRRAVVEVVGAFTYAVISVAMAAAGYGYWSMVVGWTVSVCLNTLTVWLLSPWRPSLRFSREESLSIINYGKHLVTGVLATFILFQLDKATVGKVFGVWTLGCYTVAFTICSLPATNLTAVVNRVMFPTYSRLHHDLDEIRRVYLRTIRSLASVAFPITAALLLLSGPAIRLLYGEKWAAAIPLFHILAFYGMIRAIGATAETVFMATGQTALVRKASLIQLTVGALFVYPSAKLFGVQGVAVLFTIAYASGTLYGLWRVQGTLGIRAPGWVGSLRAPALASAAAGVVAGIAVARLTQPTMAALLAVGVVLGSAYGASMFVLDRSAITDLLALATRRSETGGSA